MINIEEIVLNLSENPTETKELENVFNSYLDSKTIQELQDNISFITDAYETKPNAIYLNIFIQMAILEISSPIISTVIQEACNKKNILKKIIHKDDTKYNALLYQKYTLINKQTKNYVYDKSKGFIEIVTCDWQKDNTIVAKNSVDQHFYSFTEFINNAHIIQEGGLIEKILSKKKTIKNLNVPTISNALYKEISSFKEEVSQILIMHLIFPIFFKKADQFKKWHKDNLTSQINTKKENLIRSLQELYSFLKKEPTKLEIEEKSQDIDAILKKDIKININTLNIFILLQKIHPKYIVDRQNFITQIPIWDNENLYELFNNISAQNTLFLVEVITVIQPLQHTLKFIKYFQLQFFNKLLTEEDIPQILDYINQSDFRNNLSSDFILWLWKNKQFLSKENRIKFLTPNNLFRSLQYGSKKSIHLVKDILFNQTDTLKFIVHDENTIKQLISSIKNSVLKETEKEILFSHTRKDFPDFKKLFSKQNKALENKIQENNITSFHSYRLKEEELKNINQVQIPENLDAIATAKEFGDLKENAEFKAAKERQKYLEARKMQLQLDLIQLKPTDFKDIKVKDTVVIGCTVNLSHNKEYTILGIADSNPEKNYISCNTSLAQILLNKKVNQEITLPNGDQVTITKISPLSNNILKEIL